LGQNNLSFLKTYEMIQFLGKKKQHFKGKTAILSPFFGRKYFPNRNTNPRC
jgi:hypothetical protein